MENTSARATVQRECSVVRSHGAPQIQLKRRVFNQVEFDEEFGFVGAENFFRKTLGERLRKRCSCSVWCWINSVLGFIPIVYWLPKYSVKKDLIHDFIAGLTVGIMHIPQGMAYAGLAGLDPVYGLYMGFFPSLFYMIFGTSRHVSHGVFAVLSLMTGSVRYRLLPGDDRLTDGGLLISNVSESPAGTESPCADQSPAIDPSLAPITLLTALTLAVGLFQVLMGILHLGFASAYLSDQVVSGFTTGAAVHVLTAQINKLLGVKLPRYNVLGKQLFVWRDLIYAVPSTNVATLVTSLICIIVLIIVKEFINPTVKKKIKIPLPIDLILIIIVTAVSYFAQFQRVYDMKVVDHIPTGLPAPTIPRLDLFQYIWGDAIGIAIVGVGINLSLAKIFAKKYGYRIDSNQETLASGIAQVGSSFFLCHPESASLARSALVEEMGQKTQEFFALGFMNSLCSLFSCFPATAPPARTCVYVGAGVRTQLASIFSCSLLFIVVQWLGPLFQALPMCVLSAIIVVALKGMFMQLGELRTLWPVSKIDFTVWLVTFLGTVCLDVKEGLALGVVVALLTVVFRSQWAPSLVLGNIPDTDLYKDKNLYQSTVDLEGIKLFRFDSPLIFANAELFRESLLGNCDIDLAKAVKWKNEEEEEEGKGKVIQNGPVSSDDDLEADPPKDGVISGDVLLEEESGMFHPPECPDFMILDCSSFNYVDSQGLNVLKEIYEELDEIGVRLLFAGCKAPIRDMMELTKFYETVPKSKLYLSVHDAVVSAQIVTEKKTKREKTRRVPVDTTTTV